DCSEASFDLLHGLTTGHSTQRIGEFTFGMLVGELIPELFSTTFGQRVFFLNTAAESNNFFGGEVTRDVVPRWIGVPILLELVCCPLRASFLMFAGQSGVARSGYDGILTAAGVEVGLRLRGVELGSAVLLGAAQACRRADEGKV